MDTKALIKILRNISTLLEIQGENPFKSRAYTNAADIISDQGIDLETHVRNKTLGDIKGFGNALVSKITEYFETGKMSFYEKLTGQIPESLLELTKIPGLGPRKIKLLYDEIGITDLEKLEQACNDNSITIIKGFTSKTAEDILTYINFFRAFKGHSLQQNILEIAEKFLVEVKKCEFVANAEFAGDMRRWSETIGDLILVISSDNKSEVVKYIESISNSVNTIVAGIKADYNGIKVKIVIVGIDEFVPALHRLTGSEEYLAGFNKHLENKGISIVENTIYKNNEQVRLNDEHALYELAGLQYIPPIIRENSDIIETVQSNGLPELIEPEDIKGVVHVHTTWSDGKHSVREMAMQAKELGYEYIVITDHSKSSVVANGLKEDRILQQHSEIELLNSESLGIYIFKGIECDILNDGSLDYSEDILKLFDVVIASVHNNFRMKKEEMTERIIRAVTNPYTTMLGHPTGRLLLARQAYETDIKRIIDAAAEYNKIIEINSNPYRLDLSWENARYASSKGVKMSINPDSHRKETITDIYWGVNVAQKALLGRENIVNCLNTEDFRKQVCNRF